MSKEPDLIQTAINIAIKKGHDFVSLIKCDTKEEAAIASDKLVTIVDRYSAEDKAVNVDIKSDKSGHFVTLVLTDIMVCGGEVNKYCARCGVFHFDHELTPADLIRKKKEVYEQHYESIRNKSDA